MLSPRYTSPQPMTVKLNQNQQKQKYVHASTVATPTTHDKCTTQPVGKKGVPLLQLAEIQPIDSVRLFRLPSQDIGLNMSSEKSPG